ncbi:DUF72 domain-containing protein [Methylolobus aquaticus]|nr:DUF72 domain-containing protein [Methylolobus aquaticus]
MANRVLIGTASWTDKTLIDSGLFYPATVRTPEERLRFYAAHFPLVEVDSSYYAMPSARNSVLWSARTPPGFVFDVKAFRLFTQHQTPPAALPRDIREALGTVGKKNLYYRDLPGELLDELWHRFREAIRPLRHDGKLGVVLFQFPPWFVHRASNLQHILACRQHLADIPIAVEFRHRSWFEAPHRDAVLAFAREHGLAHVIADEPQGFASSVPSVWEVTASVAVVRLHGRNALTWNAKGLASAADRFNYRYAESELRELADSIRELSHQTGQVHVLFNNNFGDQAQRNAMELQGMLKA